MRHVRSHAQYMLLDSLQLKAAQPEFSCTQQCTVTAAVLAIDILHQTR